MLNANYFKVYLRRTRFTGFRQMRCSKSIEITWVKVLFDQTIYLKTSDIKILSRQIDI
jgi:hypothetical protein